MQDAPLAQLFVSGLWVSFRSPSWPIFSDASRAAGPKSRANHRKPTVRLQGRKNSRTHCARPAPERLLRAGHFFTELKMVELNVYLAVHKNDLSHLSCREIATF